MRGAGARRELDLGVVGAGHAVAAPHRPGAALVALAVRVEAEADGEDGAAAPLQRDQGGVGLQRALARGGHHRAEAERPLVGPIGEIDRRDRQGLASRQRADLDRAFDEADAALGGSGDAPAGRRLDAGRAAPAELGRRGQAGEGEEAGNDDVAAEGHQEQGMVAVNGVHQERCATRHVTAPARRAWTLA